MSVLAGLRVIELAGLGPGPYCGMLLADLGADVVRIDRAGTVAAGPAMDSRILGRGKRSVALNLRSPTDRELLLDLVARADALVEPFRPGVAERLGIGPEQCHARNPRLVYGRLTGWGQSGPWRLHAGHDLNYIALSGALDLVRAGGESPRIPSNLVGDMAGGGLLMAFGLAAGLLQAQRSGVGTVVDAAMVDGVASLMAIVHQTNAAGDGITDENVLLRGEAPFYGVYECADGRHVTVAAVEPQFYTTLLRLLDLNPDAVPDRQDVTAWPVLAELFRTAFRSRSRDEWCELFDDEAELCFAPVLTPAEAARHPHLTARRTFLDAEGGVQPAPVPRFADAGPAEPPRPAPGPDEGRSEVLADWLGAGG